MPESTTTAFKRNVQSALADKNLQLALGSFRQAAQTGRKTGVSELPEFDALRDQARDIKNHTLAHLDYYLETFEKKVLENGGKVHWALSAADANQIIRNICRSVNARKVVKGKSMTSEEIGLNEFLEKDGLEVIETDLGEYIIQLRGEGPSHIIAPAIHVPAPKVAETFRKYHRHLDANRPLDTPADMQNEARQVLREHFVSADVGITGANFLIAETGTTVIVTNEGNGDLSQTLPKVHIVIAGIEKVVPTLNDAATVQRILARSVVGQDASVYTTFTTGPKRDGDPDGPEAYHVVLLDNGRSKVIGSQFQDMLRCIRCSACLNHCPVYGSIGGHVYGWVYTGPMGTVVTPMLLGLEKAAHLPYVSTFCGRCEAVCPMRIPLPRMMRHWREQAFTKRLDSMPVRYGLKTWAFFAIRPRMYRTLAAIAAKGLRLLGGRERRRRFMRFADRWTGGRELPAAEGETFQDRWRKQRAEKNK